LRPSKKGEAGQASPSNCDLLLTARSRGSLGVPCLQSVGAPRGRADSGACEARGDSIARDLEVLKEVTR
jgi:hypothetical protein